MLFPGPYADQALYRQRTAADAGVTVKGYDYMRLTRINQSVQLAEFLNSELVRMFGTQVNASDLRRMRFPQLATIHGTHTQRRLSFTDVEDCRLLLPISYWTLTVKTNGDDSWSDATAVSLRRGPTLTTRSETKTGLQHAHTPKLLAHERVDGKIRPSEQEPGPIS